MNTKKGFTLIELLVVIAIIGILSSVVLASLATARSKGSDAGVKSNLNSIRSQASLYYDTNGNSFGAANTDCTAGGTVFSDASVAHMIDAATSTAGQLATCANNDTAWVISVPLKTGGNWCVDSAGNAKNAVADTTNVICP